jgi:hypothetical protein
MESKSTCPECHLMFEAGSTENDLLVCPLCNRTFAALAPDDPIPAVASLPLVASGRQVFRGIVAFGAVFLLAGGLSYAYHLTGVIGSKPAMMLPSETSTPTALVSAESPPPVEIIPVIEADASSPEPAPQSRRSPPSPEPKSTPSARPAEPQSFVVPAEPPQPSSPLEKRVNRAIDRGLGYLRANYRQNNAYRNYLGLLGLTLLEGGIDADDFTVRQIASWFRSRKLEIMTTYELTLAILFLDRLGEPRDRKLIRTFGERLLAGQLECGAWTYGCLKSDEERYRPLEQFSIQWTGLPDLKHADRVRRRTYRGDNSNTQFAILGLWVAQRYGVPVRNALFGAERYFRETQSTDGSWTYNPNVRWWRDSMTCAGLMSLAMRHAVIGGQGQEFRPAQPILVNDAAVLEGMQYLGQALDKISVAGDRIVGAEAREPLYFLWSLERMAVIYNLKKIGEREWYPWAAQMLVDTQWQDGRWSELGDVIGTCFALLILKRSNFAQDLQLAVKEPPGQEESSRPWPDMSSPTVPPSLAPPGPPIIRTPNTK